MKLQDKKIIITGATGGIGGSLVKTFTDQNAKILATGTKNLLFTPNFEKNDLM